MSAFAAMFLLTPEDVEIISVQHPKRAKKVPILTYTDKTFRLVSVFNAAQADEAHAAWRTLTDKESKACVLLEEPARYSVWSQVKINKGLLSPTAPAAYIKACILIIQSLYASAQKLGNRQAEKLITGLQVNTAYQLQTAGGLKTLLLIDITAPKALPRWEEDDLSALLLELHRLGCKFFGRKKFTESALASLDALPGNDKPLFLNWLKLSLLGNLWLS